MQKRLFVRIICYVVLLVVVVFGTKSATYIEAATTNVHLFGIHDPDGTDRWSWMDDFVGRFKTHTDSVKVKKYNYFSADNLYNSLDKAQYVYINSHGNKSSIKAISKKGKVTYLKLDRIKNSAKTKFSQLRVCFLGTCQGANLANYIYQRGAKCAIGFTNTVKTKHVTYLMECYDAYFSGPLRFNVKKSISMALTRTYEKYGNYGSCNTYQIYGDGNLTY